MDQAPSPPVRKRNRKDESAFHDAAAETPLRPLDEGDEMIDFRRLDPSELRELLFESTALSKQKSVGLFQCSQRLG